MAFPQAKIAWPGAVADRFFESVMVGATAPRQVANWFFRIHRVGILQFIRSHYSECYEQLDGGDKRVIRAFLDPDSLSNTYSLLGGSQPARARSEFGLSLRDGVDLVQDAFGAEATFDNSFVDRRPGAKLGAERWFFINGIITSRTLARRNRDALASLFGRDITLIHNPTQGLTNDLVESALQKFTNINTEVVARAFLEIGHALLEGKPVVVLAHSQGTIITGDVLDLIYCSISRKYFDRTNMNDEDFEFFMKKSSGTTKSGELRELSEKLKKAGPSVVDKLELYMFANGASRMCYLDEKRKLPHIESYANHHDIVTRLGSLARDDFFEEDLIRIDGSLFTCDRYGHLLQAHYLPGLEAGDYQRLPDAAPHVQCIGSSVHDPVCGNPAQRHPKRLAGPDEAKLPGYFAGKPLLPARPVAVA